MPPVTVIVPNYNHARFLPKRIESILKQTFQDFELILLDDCSTDDSRAILSSYASDPRVTIEFNKVNSGSAFKQWNRGVRLARGEYVWIAESDDYADPRLLERLLAALEADEKVTYAYCRSWRAMEDGHVDGFADPLLSASEVLRWSADFCADGPQECRTYLVLANPTANASAVVFRRKVFEQVGGADERFRIAGDWKLWASMALQGTRGLRQRAIELLPFAPGNRPKHHFERRAQCFRIAPRGALDHGTGGACRFCSREIQ